LSFSASFRKQCYTSVRATDHLPHIRRWKIFQRICARKSCWDHPEPIACLYLTAIHIPHQLLAPATMTMIEIAHRKLQHHRYGYSIRTSFIGVSSWLRYLIWQRSDCSPQLTAHAPTGLGHCGWPLFQLDPA